MKILIVEDDPKLLSHLERVLTEANYTVQTSIDGEDAQWQLIEHEFDAAVIDINLPGMNGFQIVKNLRIANRKTLVLFATARADLKDKVHGLDVGADDYLVKPFSVEELLARLRALFRRQRPELADIIRIEDLEIDLRQHSVKRGELEISLSRREFSLLQTLAEASPRAVPKTMLVERVWDQFFDSGTNVVNVYINYLRKKIDLPGQQPLIHTQRGVGFALRGPS